MCAIVLGVVLVGMLHVVPPSANLSPVRRTISEYALLRNGWVFDTAVLALAAGAAATLVALVGARLLAIWSAASGALLVGAAGLAGVVVFPKHNWAVGPSMHGDIHRVASLVAFVSLPLAAILLGRAWRRHPSWRRHAFWALSLGVLTLLCFAPIVIAILTEPITGVPWWRALPLGAVERLLGSAVVATVLALAWWAARANRFATAAAEVPTQRTVTWSDRSLS